MLTRPRVTTGPAALVLAAAVALAAPARAQQAQPPPSQQPALQPLTGQVLAHYEFTSSAQGWRIVGDTDPMPPIYDPTGGREGGCIEGIDQALGETWYFNAPAETVALLPSAIGGTLSYWLKQSGDQVSLNDDDIVIIGNAGRLSYRFPTSPTTSWTPMAVRLAPSAGWVWNWNKPATEAQFRELLAAPSQLLIRGEYVTGDDRASLDTVVLAAPPTAPEPSSPAGQP